MCTDERCRHPYTCTCPEQCEPIVSHLCWEEGCTATVDAPRSQERVYCRDHSVLRDVDCGLTF